MQTYQKPDWAIAQGSRRNSGIVEDFCIHGVGHPNKAWLNLKSTSWADAVHGCCGCCKEGTKS